MSSRLVDDYPSLPETFHSGEEEEKEEEGGGRRRKEEEGGGGHPSIPPESKNHKIQRIYLRPIENH